ncbi:hypothetical protein [Methanosphaera cuniculi]|uniref:hypothetical protein n=1 Tax=Methanosphaera cuniculi TaxID=1077256 RepID=UPI0026DC3DCF|nr:hypothetical protein [Methanosphaera cuniculi]
MILKCDICGHEFDLENAGCCDCGFGCGGSMVKCPECGLHMDLPEELREEHERIYNEKTIFAKLEKKLAEDEQKQQ